MAILLHTFDHLLGNTQAILRQLLIDYRIGFNCLKCLTSILQYAQFRRYSIILLNSDVVIVGAVRSQVAKHELKGFQLAGLVIDEVVKRAKLPREQVDELVLCVSQNNPELDHFNVAAVVADWKKFPTTRICNGLENLDAFNGAVETLRKKNNCCIIFGDAYQQKVDNKLEQLNLKPGIFGADIMPIRLQKQRIQAVQSESESDINAAAAMALTTSDNAKQLDLHPLARVFDFEMATTKKEAVAAVLKRNALKETDLSIMCSASAPITHLLAQVTHALPPCGIGCAVLEYHANYSAAILLEWCKPTNVQAGKELPVLTLYTKEPCPLCDDLVEALEDNFSGEYQLKKVYIDQKENIRFLRLFRHDIPVLYLNGRFICMHTLNVELLRNSLKQLKIHMENA